MSFWMRLVQISCPTRMRSRNVAITIAVWVSCTTYLYRIDPSILVLKIKHQKSCKSACKWVMLFSLVFKRNWLPLSSQNKKTERNLHKYSYTYATYVCLYIAWRSFLLQFKPSFSFSHILKISIPVPISLFSFYR